MTQAQAGPELEQRRSILEVIKDHPVIAGTAFAGLGALSLAGCGGDKDPTANSTTPLTTEQCEPYQAALQPVYMARAEQSAAQTYTAKVRSQDKSVKISAQNNETAASNKVLNVNQAFINPYAANKLAAEQAELKIKQDDEQGDKNVTKADRKQATAKANEAHDALVMANRALDSCKPETVKIKDVSGKERAENFAQDVKEVFQDFNPAEDFAVGPDVNFAANPEERGSAAFVQETVKSHDEVKDVINSPDTEREIAVSNSVLAALHNRPDELERAKNGEGYVAFQVKVPIAIEGTTYFVDGQMVQMSAGEQRMAGAGDVFWLFVDQQGHIVWDASFRADCANPKLIKVTPIKPGQPLPPGVEVPPEVPSKFDDDILPGDGTPASQDRGTPDVPGVGPAGQKPNNSGYLPTETPPTVPTTRRSTTTTTNGDGTPPTTGHQPPAEPTPPTTGNVPPNNGTRPPTPGV